MITTKTQGKHGGIRVVEFERQDEFMDACREAVGEPIPDDLAWAFDRDSAFWQGWGDAWADCESRGHHEFSHPEVNNGNPVLLEWNATVFELFESEDLDVEAWTWAYDDKNESGWLNSDATNAEMLVRRTAPGTYEIDVFSEPKPYKTDLAGARQAIYGFITEERD